MHEFPDLVLALQRGTLAKFSGSMALSVQKMLQRRREAQLREKVEPLPLTEGWFKMNQPPKYQAELAVMVGRMNCYTCQCMLSGLYQGTHLRQQLALFALMPARDAHSALIADDQVG